MADPRSMQILEAAADALLSGYDPFDRAFRAEHCVTAEETVELAAWLAVLAKAFLAAPPRLQAQLLVTCPVANPGGSSR